MASTIRYSIKKVVAGFVLLAGLVACTPANSVTPIPTDQPAIPTNPPAATSTIAPTATPTLSPIALDSFSAQLEGVGSNGTMACFSYAGNLKDLENLTLTANISQGKDLIENNIPSQQIEGKTCFEVVDARYVTVNPDDGTLIIPDSPVMLEINATSTVEREVANSKQTLDLGSYIQFPFLSWIYDTTKVCKINEHKGYIDWDFIPYPSSEYPTIIGTKILSPTEGYAFAVSLPSETGSITYNSIVIYSTETGFLIDLTHVSDTFFDSHGKYKSITELIGTSIFSGDTIARIGPKDDHSGIPHTHMQISIPTINIDASSNPFEIWEYTASHNVPDIDFIKSRLFLDDSINSYLSNLPNNLTACSNFTWGTLSTPPSQLPITIDGKEDDWEGYSPVLTDPSGDSQSGNIMDFTELYTARDDNYLYIMVKAGDNNGSKLWAAQFFVNTDGSNKCSGADKLITIDASRPSPFFVSDIQSCDDLGDNALYSAEYAWGDVIEIKIPLIYLGSPDTLDITKLIGFLIVSDGYCSESDTMP